jgi:Helicase conserved C-terminal domain
MSPGPPVRSVAEWLRERSDDDLAALLTMRPDLVSPVPPDVGMLAARATTRSSVLRALDLLDRAEHGVLEALCLLPEPAPFTELQASLTGELALSTLRAALTTLRTLALVWGDDDALRVVATVRQVTTHPAGLGPPIGSVLDRYPAARISVLLEALGLPLGTDVATGARTIAALMADPAEVLTLVKRAGEATRPVLDALSWSPVGAVPDALRAVRPDDAETPVRRLLAYGLLVAIDSETVVLPREVGLALRGGKLFPPSALERPMLERVTTRSGNAQVDRTAAGQAFSAVRAVIDLLDAWSVDPPPVLKAGGLGVRELRRWSRDLDLDEPVTAAYLESAYAAGLLAASTDLEPVWLPTPGYDTWRRLPPERQWVALADAWLATTRLPGLVGAKDDRDRTLSVLSADIERSAAPDLRRTALSCLAELPKGAAATADSVVALVSWLVPRRAPARSADQVTWALAEAAALGVTGAGALSVAGRSLLFGDPAAASAALEPLLPQPVDHVLLQADLTAIAPGPLVTELAHELSLIADVESKGGATVYRFTEGSVRRGLDAGRTSSELHALFAQHSRTPVPQGLTYLVDDVARRHGRIRVGTAGAYIRSDDPAVLAEILASRKVAPLGLRLLAPTVLAARAPVDRVLEVLRSLGHAPVAESADGDVVVRRPDLRRTTPRPRPPRLADLGAPRAELVQAAVIALRAGDRASVAARHRIQTPSSAADTVALLTDAARTGRAMWIGYLNADGDASQRIIEPKVVEGGIVRAFDHRHNEQRSFAVHRITGIGEVAPDEALG